jgi:hypothetical protein
MRTPLVRTVLAGAVAMLLVTATALADADPASDVLLGASVFYPYSPPVSAPVERALNAEVAAAARAHLPIKVALIGTPVDLGAIPSLFGKPQEYANYLDQEISFNAKQALLVVMAAGYGVQGLDPAATSAAASLAKPPSAQTDALARAAIEAIPRLAAASGHRIGQVSPAKASGGSSAVVPAVILGAVAVAGAAAVIVVRRRVALRRRATPRRN